MALAGKNEHEVTPFDDVDLLETENSSTVDKDSCMSNLSDVQTDAPCIPKSDITEQDFVQSKSDANFMSASVETDQLEENEKDLETESSSFTIDVDESRDDVVTSNQNSADRAEHDSVSCHRSMSLSSEVVNIDCNTPSGHTADDGRNFPSGLLADYDKTLPSGHTADDSSPEMLTAVLTLDSDVDSPLRQKTDCNLTSDDGMEVDVAALQRQTFQLTAERDEYMSLYSQSKEDIENYQEQLLEVWAHILRVKKQPKIWVAFAHFVSLGNAEMPVSCCRNETTASSQNITGIFIFLPKLLKLDNP